ncbi:hypothetical protein N7471_013105 [Penicillium samsonianum]|uniref:uncharacterized protein n=1 Tax=Penicillium samsonianum TaxID=1882272 RepID=UPI002549BE09|nr:uncharacterized protein N7471_013105 [Penicillium samsonianum]KAJ6118485.1 hypothetical protein N7471_013105 [Penicillium samsonianum]
MSESTFDPQRSAELHNQILQYAWTGAGYISPLPSTTWWEEYSPVNLDSRLTPKLAQFLRSARSIPSRGWSDKDPGIHFFYFLSGLQNSDHLLQFPLLDGEGDRFVYLYQPTGCYTCDEEVGIVFDQNTELAAYIPHWEFSGDVIGNPGSWMPLQQILGGYIEMIEEGKVKTSTEIKQAFSQFFPWEYCQYTQRDIDKSIAAFTRLLDAIETRLPVQSYAVETRTPESVFNEAFVPNNSFIRSFLSALPPRQIHFRYIAPGIWIQSAAELKHQSYAAYRAGAQSGPDDDEDDSDDEEMPFLLFRADGSNLSPWGRPFDNIDIPAGLYTEEINKSRVQDFGNMSRPLLPFGVGSRGYARDSSGRQIGLYASPTPIDYPHELYQVCGWNGILETHGVQLHKVLLNWAERVEMGDWELDENGVAGGIEKFKDADTPGNWEKYQIPLSW